MDKKAITLAAAMLLRCELGHAAEIFEYPSAREVRLHEPFVFDNRSALSPDHSHTEGPEELVICTNQIAASGNQLFEVYAIVSEGPLFGATISAKTLAGEKLYTSEEQATIRAAELQRAEAEGGLSDVQFAVRPFE